MHIIVALCNNRFEISQFESLLDAFYYLQNYKQNITIIKQQLATVTNPNQAIFITIIMYKIDYQFKQGIVEEWAHYPLPPSNPIINLKPMQKAIINCNRRHDVLVNLPTGFGKSMLYQYQALISPQKSIVVIVPLKALLWDAILEAFKLNLSAAQLNPQEINRIDFSNPPTILFVTPQRLYKSQYAYQVLRMLEQRQKLGLFVIDQAHCVCEWGNDFRKDYSKLESLRRDFRNVRILAMTATAPPQIRNQIVQKLNLKNVYFFFSSYNRPNLVYEVRKTTKANIGTCIEGIIKKEFQGQSGIIYCQTIKLCQQLHNQLKNSIKCQKFHSKIAQSKRQRILQDFKKLKGRVIIATICFGMGINKTDVRFIIHAGIPFSMENYYQQSGRGGRDGKLARCILLSFPGQQNTLLYLLDRTKKQYRTIPKIFVNKKAQLNMMLRYVMNRQQCRKKYMFRMMGENFENCNKTCDICLKQGKTEQLDFTENGSRILHCMSQSNIKVTLVQLRDILKGKSLKNQFNSMKSINGILKSYKQDDITQIIQELLYQDYFKQYIKKTKFSMIKKLLVNKNKKYLKIIVPKPFVSAPKPQYNKMADYLKKKTDTSETQLPLTSSSLVLKNEPYEQELKQAVMCNTFNYYDQIPMEESFDHIDRDSYNNSENDHNSESIQGPENEEDIQDIQIDEYDIQTLLPMVMDRQLQQISESFTEGCLFPKQKAASQKMVVRQSANVNDNSLSNRKSEDSARSILNRQQSKQVSQERNYVQQQLYKRKSGRPEQINKLYSKYGINLQSSSLQRLPEQQSMADMKPKAIKRLSQMNKSGFL